MKAISFYRPQWTKTARQFAGVVAARKAAMMHRRKFSFVMMNCMRRKCASMSPKMNSIGASHGEYGGRAKGRLPAWIITWSAALG